MLNDIVIIDYGLGNLLSVQRAFESLGIKVSISSNPREILSASRVVLPGVGAFSKAMQCLKERKLHTIIKEIAHNGTPLLGICLGMQLLFDESQEFDAAEGLGLIHGKVLKIQKEDIGPYNYKIPHIGWSSISKKNDSNWELTALRNSKEGEFFYFAHSYFVELVNPNFCLAYINYGNLLIPAVISSKNIIACQFHPEKSGEVGLKILKQFSYGIK